MRTDGSTRLQCTTANSNAHGNDARSSPSDSRALDAASSSERSSKACCFCCLTVQNNEANNPGQANGIEMVEDSSSRPSYQEVKSWATSFDRMMRNRTGQKLFADFLKSEFSDENILFWQACEELKRERNQEKIEEKARIIYEDFISILSPKEVSLDSRVREIINSNMVHPTAHTFDEAQTQIYTLMHRDSYPRFVTADHYRKLLASYGECEEL